MTRLKRQAKSHPAKTTWTFACLGGGFAGLATTVLLHLFTVAS